MDSEQLRKYEDLATLSVTPAVGKGMADLLGVPERSLLQFEGPPTFHCFGTRYTLIGVRGPVPEGGEQPTAETEAEAWSLFWKALKEHAAGATQIAWRRYPVQEERKDGFIVTARLAVWR